MPVVRGLEILVQDCTSILLQNTRSYCNGADDNKKKVVLPVNNYGRIVYAKKNTKFGESRASLVMTSSDRVCFRAENREEKKVSGEFNEMELVAHVGKTRFVVGAKQRRAETMH